MRPAAAAAAAAATAAAAAAAAARLLVLVVLLSAAACGAADVVPSNTLFWGEGFANDTSAGVENLVVFNPQLLPGSVPLVSVASGAGFACGLDSAGRAYCIGGDSAGQLGVGTGQPESGVPLPVAGGKTYSSIHAGMYNTYACGLISQPGAPEDKTLECWCACCACCACCVCYDCVLLRLPAVVCMACWDCIAMPVVPRRMCPACCCHAPCPPASRGCASRLAA